MAVAEGGNLSNPAVGGRRRTIVGLHYLRALATIMVVVVHSFGIASHSEFFKTLAFGGFLRVPAGEIDFFFVMSGFIMVASTYDAKTCRPRMSASEFFRRRFFRIFPLLWVSVLSYAALRLLSKGNPIEIWNAARALVAWPVGQVDPNVTWTIRHEVAFYIVFGLFFLRFSRFSYLSLVWFLAPVALAILFGEIPYRSEDLLFYLCSPYNLEFGVGVAIGILFVRLRPTVTTLRFQLPIIVAALLALRACIFITGLDKLYGSLAYTLALTPFLVAIVVLAVKTDPVSETKAMVFLGDASYSIFLFHPHFITPIFMILAKLAPWLPSWAAASIAVVTIIPLTCLIHLWVEKPLMRLSSLRAHTIPRAASKLKPTADLAP